MQFTVLWREEPYTGYGSFARVCKDGGDKIKYRKQGFCRLYVGRTCPSQENLVSPGVFLCAIDGADCGGRELKGLQVDGREFQRQMAKELREDSIFKIKSSQLELFPGKKHRSGSVPCRRKLIL
ncbi:hypothetical protein J6590_077658 [Homalodisca vitripennis]|nr:hypothetical protein J6590_077658 [Homalodisca vitripennis]